MSKDWKGNSNSLHAAIAAHRGGGKSMRQEDDFYATDPKALRMLIEGGCSAWLNSHFTNIQRHHVPIWECACGNGNLATMLKFSKGGFDVIATDLKDRGYGLSGNDFLKMDANWLYHNIFYTVDTILTNPPYSLATEFIEHALDILPDGGLYIAFMNIGYLAGQKRWQRVYQFGTLREVYVFSKRMEVWKNGEPPKDKCGSIANYAWYVFQKGYKGQPTLYWL